MSVKDGARARVATHGNVPERVSGWMSIKDAARARVAKDGKKDKGEEEPVRSVPPYLDPKWRKPMDEVGERIRLDRLSPPRQGRSPSRGLHQNSRLVLLVPNQPQRSHGP